MKFSDQSGSSGSVPDLYSGYARSKSRPGHQLYSLKNIFVFPSPSNDIPGERLKLGHGCFLPHPFQFIIIQ